MNHNVSSMAHYRRRRRRAGNVRWLLLLLFFLACAVGGYFFGQSPLFNISKIEVSGLNALTEEDVILHSGISVGEHIYKINTNLAAKLIATDPWVKSVTVKRRLPSTIQINVTERVAVAMVPYTNGVLQVDAEGYVLKTQKLLDGMPLMILAGISDIPADVLPGQQLESDSLKKGLSMVAVLTQDAAGIISEIDVSDTQQIIVQNIYGVEWRVGDGSNFMNKFKIANQITADEEAAGRLGQIVYIDVSLMDKPTIAYRKSGSYATGTE